MDPRFKFDITEVLDPHQKSIYTQRILEALPQWFGNRQALDEYVEKVRELPYWAALDGEGRCVGFLSGRLHYSHTGEIFVCGVLPPYRRHGIGRKLCCAAETYFSQTGCRYMMVKTLSDIVDFEPYAQTRAFYESMGFQPLITLTEMWDEENPCLIMIKALP